MPVFSWARGCLLLPPVPSGDPWFACQARVHPRLVIQQSAMGHDGPPLHMKMGVHSQRARGPETSIYVGTPEAASNLTWERVGTPHCCFEHAEETRERERSSGPRATFATEVLTWSRCSSGAAGLMSTRPRLRPVCAYRTRRAGGCSTCRLSARRPPTFWRSAIGSK